MNTPAINLKDGYKIDHVHQFPNINLSVNNWTPRKSRNPEITHVVNFGIQAFIKEWLIDYYNRTFFNVPKEIAVAKYKRRINNLGAYIDISHIEALWDKQYLPITIMALPEGVETKLGIPHYINFNTEPGFHWLPGALETLASCELWKPSTSATNSRHLRKILTKYSKLTCDNDNHLDFQAWDFSLRGMSGVWDGMQSGAAHLLSFRGSDTICAVDYLEDYYGANSDEEFICGGIMATEHQIMCSNTGFYIKTKYNDDWEYQGEAELDTFRRLITEVYPTGGVSIVSDTWSLPKVLTVLLPALKEEILARDGFVVIRPDSFWTDPVDCLCGYYEDHPKMVGMSEEEIKSIRLGVVEYLGELFGTTINNKGYKILNPKIAAIYGDGLNFERVYAICERLMAKKYASSNWVGGIGSYFFQFHTRDSFGFAQKCTYVEFEHNNEKIGIEIFKDPVTDDGTKKSAKGLLAVFKDNEGEYYLKDQATWDEVNNCEFKTIFKNGVLFNETTYAEIRERLGTI